MIAQSSVKVAAAERPPGYPVELELKLDGLAVRPVVPQDAGRLAGEFAAADAETLRMRFFVPAPHLTSHDFERLTTVDYLRRLAITAWDDDQPVAIARYEPAGETTAEVAFVVKPAYRNRGIGRRLIEILARSAANAGYEELSALYLAENTAAAAALAAAGFTRHAADGSIVEVRRDLRPPRP